jgi:hypothetical protein
MPTLTWWTSEDTHTRWFVVNGAMRVAVDEFEARSTDDYVRLVARRVAACVWLAMPGHEGAGIEATLRRAAQAPR